MKTEEKPRLFPEHFPIGQISGSQCDFTKGKISFPRGGEDPLEYWYTDDPEESEYLNDDFQKNIELKIEHLKKEGWDPMKQKFWATTQSHLDLGWMWQFRQGVAKAERTFAKVHGHFKLFNPFTFTGSQPAQYQWVKFNSPEIWEKIVADVANGRHEIQGGCWSEADGRMPSGEAWVRQRLYGQLFYARNFGKIANIEWFPDSFGYADNMPQIFARSGAEGFMTNKLTSNKQTKWPFWVWWWEGPDGSKLLSYLSGNHNKLGPLGGFDVPQHDSPIRESYVKSYRLLNPGTSLTVDYEVDKPEENPNVSEEELPLIACFFGEGDGGHGPQGVEMAVYRGFAERGHVKWVSTAEIFTELAKFGDRLPVWKDELYYEFHKGSLTTQAMMKRMNRKYEWTLPMIEGLHALITAMKPDAWSSYNTFYTDPKDQIQTATTPIEQMWQNCCLMQFHDVLPGTSLPEVYDECYEFWSQDISLMNRLKSEAMQELQTALHLDAMALESHKFQTDNCTISLHPTLISNTSGAGGKRFIEITQNLDPDVIPIAILVGSERYPIQAVEGDKYGFILDRKPDRLVFSVDLPAWTTALAWIVGITPLSASDIDLEKRNILVNQILGTETLTKYSIKNDVESIILSTPYHQLSISKQTGKITQIFDKKENILNRPAGLETYLDKPNNEFCWNLMPNWWEHSKKDFTSVPEISIREQGPVRWTVRVTQSFGSASKTSIDYIVYYGLPGFSIEVGVDFHETETLLKYEFPFNINTNYTIAETPYSTAKRMNNPVANHDIPRWEKWMHTFVTLEDEQNKRGVAIINEGKYGFDTKNDRLGISLLRGPQYVGFNVVAWVAETRKARLNAGLGQPPTHADQGDHLIRLWILPYEGSWQEGKIHHFAHAFNALAMASILKTPTIGNNKINEGDIETKLKDFVKNGKIWHHINTSTPTIEVTVLKVGELLPDFMDNMNNQNNSNSKPGLVIRVVNNCKTPNSGTIYISPLILRNATAISEVDLLERPLPGGLMQPISTEKECMVNLDLSFKPHEIRTFKFR